MGLGIHSRIGEDYIRVELSCDTCGAKSQRNIWTKAVEGSELEAFIWKRFWEYKAYSGTVTCPRCLGLRLPEEGTVWDLILKA